MSEKKSIDVVIAQQKLSLRTDQNPQDVQNAAELVNRKLSEVLPFGQPVSQQILLLVAMNLADELLHVKGGMDLFKSDLRERSSMLLTRLEKEFPLT